MTSNLTFNLNQGEKKIEKYIFSMKKVLGKGSYAYVYMGRSIYDDEPVAVKVIEKKIFANKYNLKNIQSQIDIMKKVDHPNMVKLMDIYQTQNNMYIVTQLCQEGDLSSYLKKKKKLPQNQAIKFLKDIVCGFKYLSDEDIMHRDLKPANILLNNGKCKISDFGFARSLDYGESTVLQSIVGTPLYMSPQILKRQTYTNKSDLWSVGLIYYQMLHGRTPWPASNQIQLINGIYSKQIHFDSSISQKSKDFIKRCLKIKQQQRMSWDDAYYHPIFINRQQQKQNMLGINSNNTATLRKLIIDENYNIVQNKYSKSKSKRRNINFTPTPKKTSLKPTNNVTPQRRSPLSKFCC